VEQELILAGRDFDALRALVSELQSRLNLRSVGFGVSQARRIEAQREMQAAALAAFREDAERIRTALGATGFEIVELDVSAGPPDPVRSRARMASVSMAAESEPMVAPVVLEGGHSEVVARVRARIQLLR
jgi:predicted secreted protein